LDAARTNVAALFEAEDDAAQDIEDSDEEEVIEASTSQEAPTGLLASAKSLRRRAEAILDRGVSETDTNEIRNLLATSSTAITHRDWPSLQEADDKLSDVLFYLED
jgi:hypothetical protein